MILEAVFGAIAGGFGVIPFVHTNLILQTVSPFIANPVLKAIFSISVSASHSLFEILSTLIIITGLKIRRVDPEIRNGGTPENDQMEFSAIYYTAFKALVCSICILPIVFFLLPLIKTAMAGQFKYIFLSLIVAQFFCEKNIHKAAIGIGVFLFAGILGSITFYKSIVAEPLFPLLSGFFALPALLLGESEPEYGEEGMKENTVSDYNTNQLILLAAFSAAISTLFPALTVGVLLGTILLMLRDSKLIPKIVPALIVSKVFFDIAASAITGNTRSYAAVLAKPLTEYFEGISLLLISSVALFSGCLALAFILHFKNRISRIYCKMENPELRRAFLIGILALIFIFGGVVALILAATACCMGIMGNQLKTKRSYLMGSLILPSLMYLFELGLF
jgi:TctA family transporter